MFVRLRRSSRKARVALAAATAAALIGGALYWYAETPRYDAPVPAADATPRQVAKAYMTALDAGDADTARALSTPRQRESADTWLSTTAHMRERTTSHPQERSGKTPEDHVGKSVYVPVNFTLQQKWWHFYDPSMPDGRHDWGYVLVRDHGRWLVNDEGME